MYIFISAQEHSGKSRRDYWDKSVSEEEARQVIFCQKHNKASGPDKVPNEVLCG